MTATLRLQPARVIVDPNSVVPGDPTLTAATFGDADRLPSVGEIVVASQPDDDGFDFTGRAEVVEINQRYSLIMLRVDWPSFREVPASSSPPELSSAANPVVYGIRAAMAAWRALGPAEGNGATQAAVAGGGIRLGVS